MEGIAKTKNRHVDIYRSLLEAIRFWLQLKMSQILGLGLLLSS